jgi:hypothetical protein
MATKTNSAARREAGEKGGGMTVKCGLKYKKYTSLCVFSFWFGATTTVMVTHAVECNPKSPVVVTQQPIALHGDQPSTKTAYKAGSEKLRVFELSYNYAEGGLFYCFMSQTVRTSSKMCTGNWLLLSCQLR